MVVCSCSQENFHQVLSDISLGRASNEVRQFVCESYLRGARIGNAENCDFEGSTAVMTKRRYRDRFWGAGGNICIYLPTCFQRA